MSRDEKSKDVKALYRHPIVFSIRRFDLSLDDHFCLTPLLQHMRWPRMAVSPPCQLPPFAVRSSR